jgi:type I restriction enzyme S subunit
MTPVLLGDLFELKYGKSLRKDHRIKGAVPVFGSNGQVDLHNKSLINHPTIIVGRKGSIGEIHLIKKPCWPIDTTYFVKPLEKHVFDLEWLYRLLGTLRLQELNRSAAIPGLNRDDVYRISVLLPPLNDQIRIAHLLGKVEGLIAQRKQHLQQLDDLLKSVFLEMFGKDIRDESSYLAITSACEFIDYRGKTPPRADFGVPLISAKCVRKGYFDATRLDYVAEETYQKIMTRGFPEPNDVLFTTEGATFGYTCRVPKDFSKFSVGQRLITMQCKDGYQPEVLEFVLNDQHIQKKLASRLSGSAALGIRSAELVKVDIPFPNPADQLRFAAIVEKVESLKSSYQQSLTDLETLYGALSQQAFKGELDLSRVPLPENDIEEREGKLEVDLIQLHEKFKVLPEIQKTLETLGQNSPEFEKVMAVARKATEAVSFASELPIIPELNESIIAAQKVLKPLNMPQFTQLQEVSELSKRVSDVFKALGLPVQSNQLSQSYIQSIEAARKVTEQFKLPKWMEANTKLVDNLIPKSMQRQLELIERSAEGFENEGQTENEDNEKKEYKLLRDEEIFSQLAPEFESFLVEKKGEILNLDDFWNRAVIQNLLSNDEEGNKWGPFPPTDLEFWRKTGSLKLYDKVKSYIFDAINGKKVSQEFNIEKNMIELRIVN